MTRQLFEEIATKVVERFSVERLHVGMLVGTIELGNNCKCYKVVGINTDAGTVKIILPDSEAETVSIASLYDPSDAEVMFWKIVEGDTNDGIV